MPEIPVPVPVLYRPMWIFAHLALIFSTGLNVFLTYQLQCARNTQEELIRNHAADVKRHQKWINEHTKKDNFP